MKKTLDIGPLEKAQPAQEPLAWMCSAFDGEPCEQTNHDECGNPISLYTTPPQREWVDLTDEDKSELAKAQHSWEDLCLAVESKLKERNYGT